MAGDGLHSKGTTTSTSTDPLSQVLDRLDGVHRSGDGWSARCPAHDDRQASLSIRRGNTREVLLKCHAGCEPEMIVLRTGLDPREILGAGGGRQNGRDHRRNGTAKAPGSPRSPRSIAATYDYVDESGALVYQVVRYRPKGFSQRRPNGKGGWIWNLDGVRRLLYHLPDLLAADPETIVFVVEGEKDVDRLRSLGLVATCNSEGAGKWPKVDASPLHGRRVVVIPDNDKAGLEQTRDVEASLAGRATVAQLVLDGLPEHGDASEWLDAGHTGDELRVRAEAALADVAGRADVRAGSETEPTAAPVAEIPWPDDLADAAFHGPIGALVRAVAPLTEASAPAILAHVLSMSGAHLGDGVHARVGTVRHPPRVNTLVIGPTATGRKGSAAAISREAGDRADEKFMRQHVTSGLSSGEGLIWAVRDPIVRRERVGKGSAARYEDVEVDAGVSDKRLWVLEPEFASVLRVMQRDGSTLSAVVRQAWDGGTLNTLVKNNPARATLPHIAITGHIVPDELRRYLDRSELAGGFINRFLLFAARRPHTRPDGDEIPDRLLEPFAKQLREARAWAKQPRILRRDDGARALWAERYEALTADREGLYGAACSRAEAQILRLSVLYAAIECSELIRLVHLEAALAVWAYCDASAQWAFGDATGDPVADEILTGLRRTGELDRTDIYQLLGRHVSRPRIATALGLLLRLGRAGMQVDPTAGRSREVWFPCR